MSLCFVLADQLLILVLLLSLLPATLPDDLSSLPWDDLASSLSSSDSLSVNSDFRQLWVDQCVPIFQAESFPNYAPLQNGSNYQLIDQPNGLCADILACAWKYCDWSPTSLVEIQATELADYFDPDSVPDETWNLPAATVHPKTVGDIIASIEFAKEHDIGMSVKVSGHNYVGASTDKDSLLIHMRKYPKYAIDDTNTSLLECGATITTSSNSTTDQTSLTTNDLRAWACQVAMARNYSAILRVGGGEIWDEVYRSVSIWNANNGTQVYHILGGGAGTVGAAGGYLGGTGLSGTTGMRMFGFAADQVTQMEMVLPTGQHVRFGPTEWTSDPDLDWPRTTKVTGWCNTNPVLNESEWKWQVCSDGSINFDDLWHAVRGGGNGYGVTTAVEYQLHDYPGEISTLAMGLPDDFAGIASAACGECEQAYGIIAVTWLDFLIDITWNPSALNVTEEDSNKCGGPDGGASLGNVFGTPSLQFCYGDAGNVWAAAWTNRMSVSALQESLLNASATQEMIDIFSNALIPRVFGTFVDYATFIATEPTPGVPQGRAPDNPRPFVTYNWAQDNLLVPIEFLVEQRDVSIPWMFGYAAAGSGNYVMGGRIARYHDGTTATNPLYRKAGFMANIVKGNAEGINLSRTLLQYYNGVEGTPQDKFPGGSEFNHYQGHFMGPLKSNWSEPCPVDVTREQRNEECIPLMEYIFGTEGLARLESIKAAVDPMHLFNCYGCVGYRETTGTSPSSSPNDATTTSPSIQMPTVTSNARTVMNIGGSIVATVVAGLLVWYS